MKSKILFTILALGATVLTAISQPSVGTGSSPGTYTPVLIPLPTPTLATGTATNIPPSWTRPIYTTNITVTYSNGAAGWQLVTNTQVFTNTFILASTFFHDAQRRMALEWSGTASAAGATNVLIFARGVLGTAPSSDTFSWTIPVNQGVGTNTVAVTNLPADFIGPYGYLFCMTQTNSGAGTITNSDGGFWAGLSP